jgi:quinolinate synthase
VPRPEAGREELAARIRALCIDRAALILAHVYTLPEVQDVADYVGDSLGLSQQAARAGDQYRIILFCGVYFMAETAALLSPGKKVLVPDPSAGCPMADMVSAEEVRALRAAHPGALVACYVNSTVAVKAESDVCVTSSNAVKIVAQLPGEEVIFVPDESLGAYVQAQVPGKRLVLWPGFCPTHRCILPAHIDRAREAHPGALVLAHPECTGSVLALADFIGSTGQIQAYARSSKADEFIVASEHGILYRLAKDNPGKAFHPAADIAVCPNMKKTTLEKVLGSLEHEDNVVRVDEASRARALAAINRMLELS